MPAAAAARMVREQLAFALNRAGGAGSARDAGGGDPGVRAASETNGLLGRVYKDRWEEAMKAGTRALEVRGIGSAPSRATARASRPTGVTPILA